MSSPQIKPRIPKGTRDFLPDDLSRRRYVINLVQSVFERYGYEPLETPAMENLDILTGKYGEEGEQLIFKILKRGVKGKEGEADLGLRYDLTVPLSRAIAMYESKLVFPFKRYQIQPVWRGDRPQKFRYREFYQCDVDVVGSSSKAVDAEMIGIIYDIFSKIGFSQFKIRINHRKILSSFCELCGTPASKEEDICVAIDKLDKVGMDGVREELKTREVAEESINKILEITKLEGNGREFINRVKTVLESSLKARESLAEIEEMFSYLNNMGIPEACYTLDLSLARGMSYYTGPIFEAEVHEPKAGSLCGGGRYDGLIGMFLGRNIPACGTTIGLERIIDVMTELDMFPKSISSRTQVLVTVFNEDLRKASIVMAQKLRQAGFATELYLGQEELRKQIKYAVMKNIRFVIVIGPEEHEKNEVNFQDTISHSREKLNVDNITSYIQEKLKQ